MKTKIFSLIAVAAIALGIGNQALADGKNDSVAKNNNEVSTVLTNVSKINKIEVRGNVELYVSDGEADQVKVYNKYYEQSALVQSQNGVLRISSYAGQKLVVWVKSTDLRAITAYDNAEVRSFGKLSPLDLTVTLNDNAYGKLRVEGYGMNVILKGRAKADLAGNVEEGTLRYNRSATMNSTEFAAAHLVRTIDGVTENRKADEFAGL
ncbi:MAG TPA: DUF2807 domain-containing protein [Mucilaginibacter sp.]|nr:DUF2807 domain-containing protein [Mucilaginibacter sp.]